MEYESPKVEELGQLEEMTQTPNPPGKNGPGPDHFGLVHVTSTS